MEGGRFRKSWWRERERGVRYREKGEKFLFFQPRERKSIPKR